MKLRLVAVDLETDRLERNKAISLLRTFGFAYKQDGVIVSDSIPFEWRYGERCPFPEMFAQLSQFLLNEQSDTGYHWIPVFHNAAFDIAVLERFGFPVPRRFHDTMLMAWCLNPNEDFLASEGCPSNSRMPSKYGLQSCAIREGVTQKMDKPEDWDSGDIRYLMAYNRQDCVATLELGERYIKLLRQDAQAWWLYNNIEIPFVSVIREMNSTGIWFDLEKIKSIGTTLAREADEVAMEMKKMAGPQKGSVRYRLSPMDNSKIGDKPGQFILLGQEVDPNDRKKRPKFKYQALVEFNPNSNVHKKAVMEQFGLDVPSCSKADLQKFGEGHPFVELCLKYSPLVKAQTTYIEPIIQSGGFMLPSWHQTGTKTGRLSSSNPNAQNFPKRTKLGASIRECIVPPANQVFVGCDLGQIEYRILSWYLMEYFPEAEDAQRLWDTFRSGRDIHSEVSAMLGLEKRFRVGADEARFMAKIFSYGSLYGFGPQTCSSLLRMHITEARALLDIGKERTPSVYALKELFWDEFKRNRGLGHTKFGRRLYYPDILLDPEKGQKCVNYKGESVTRAEAFRLKAAAERESFNAKIQGTQADIIKIMTLNVMEPMHEIGARLVLMAHDEVLFQTFGFTLDRAKMVLEQGFSRSSENDILPGMPIVTEVGVGSNWLEVH